MKTIRGKRRIVRLPTPVTFVDFGIDRLILKIVKVNVSETGFGTVAIEAQDNYGNLHPIVTLAVGHVFVACERSL